MIRDTAVLQGFTSNLHRETGEYFHDLGYSRIAIAGIQFPLATGFPIRLITPYYRLIP
jgi:hypothetical protein